MHFPSGTTTVNFTINITDDDFYEGDESFNLTIADNLPDQVFPNELSRTTIIIRDDEESEQLLLSNLYCCLHLPLESVLNILCSWYDYAWLQYGRT